MAYDPRILKFIEEARSEVISEEMIDAEVEKMLQPGAPATPSIPEPRRSITSGIFRFMGGPGLEQEFLEKQAVVRPEAVKAQRALGNIGTLATGAAGTIPMVGMNLIQRGLEGMAGGGEPPSPAGIAAESAIMAAAPPAVKATGKIGLKAGKLIGRSGRKVAENLLGRLAGVPTEELKTAIATPAITRGTAPRASDVV